MLLSLSACSRAPKSVVYREPGGAFTVEVPSSWKVDERGPFSRRPIADVEWTAEVVDSHSVGVIGAVVRLRRVDRKPAAPSKSYHAEAVEPGDDLFAGKVPKAIGGRSAAMVATREATLSGLEARRFERDFDDTTLGGPFHGPSRSYPSRIIGVVARAPDFYYILTFKATRGLVEKHRPAFERMIETLSLADR